MLVALEELACELLGKLVAIVLSRARSALWGQPVGRGNGNPEERRAGMQEFSRKWRASCGSLENVVSLSVCGVESDIVAG